MDQFFNLHDKLMEKEKPLVPKAEPEAMFEPVDDIEQEEPRKTVGSKKSPKRKKSEPVEVPQEVEPEEEPAESEEEEHDS